jgi:hypothetical protein
MRIYVAIMVFTGITLAGYDTLKHPDTTLYPIGNGQMPNASKDIRGNLHIVFGSGDSILYSFSGNQGKTFSQPELVALLPNLFASAMRGPQIASTSNGLIIIASTKNGDIFSFAKPDEEIWQSAARVNDVDTVAKEGLMAIAGDGQTAYAVWLDLRDKHNKIFGAKSTDAGKTWSKNIMVYTSPDKTVCECCKPSVAIKGKDVFVMFRNWLNGDRDLYLIKSPDGGMTFNHAQKLGEGSWALKGCPMDGGGLSVDADGSIQTVWRRESKIYGCEPGKQEVLLGEGRSCTIETINGQNVYAWTENNQVIVMKPNGGKTSLGTGKQPILKAVDSKHLICVWENENKIQASVLEL